MIIIGIGNEFRSDDVLGLVIAREIKKCRPDINVLESSGEGSSLINLWTNQSKIIVIDAMRGEEGYGKIHKIDIHRDNIPKEFTPCSSHAFGLCEAIEMTKALGELPNYFVIFGIEGKSFQQGTEISKEVVQAIPQVVDMIRQELNHS